MLSNADDTQSGDTVIVSKNLDEKPDTTVQGKLTTESLYTGNVTAADLSLSGDLNLAGHLNPSGDTPTIKMGPAARGGSVSIVGNDTAGTVTINSGSGGAQSGELAIITFHGAFPLTPKVQLTPLNADAANLNYFASRSASFFSVNSASVIGTEKSYVFDYLVTQ